ncbi:rhodanese-like domain-containing protein [Oculatella sp. LEGE 06141]|uniref:rhodanese-like domain-containing protein n=1 Tax=Oculatella sp. LEGE 06141 TaxID=1828648 RepID=UPI00187F81BD|nr:rhodanese-like domain-containing protein [Oculatella sp. LEGE 06141]MBE9182572.1 rhodanese-like domain-containing protein [Oculatella sp. LEGE 06141]
MDNIQDTIKDAKDKLPNVTPTPPGLHKQATPDELKSRLLWGEPGLTIVDVRSREAFNDYRIMGAVPMPMDTLPESVQGQLELTRDIYVYGADDQETAQAAQTLRQCGFQNVAELKGGIDAWANIAGQTEGRATSNKPVAASEYNAVARVQEYASTLDKEKKQ